MNAWSDWCADLERTDFGCLHRSEDVLPVACVRHADRAVPPRFAQLLRPVVGAFRHPVLDQPAQHQNLADVFLCPVVLLRSDNANDSI